MKLLTVVIPCYNSAAYMSKAIESVLPGGEEVDLLIVDDGSTDDTGAIADRYVAQYPNIVRVVHQPNGGHGAGLNQGIQNGLGIYMKVLDSDDRLDPAYLPGFLDVLRAHSTPEPYLDLVIHDYVYDRLDKQAAFAIDYRLALPANRDLTWETIRGFPFFSLFMIHCMTYRIQVLRDMGLVLPEHVFYEDNLYIYQPLPYVKTLMYFNRPLHAYFIGRGDQSINKDVIIRRLPQVAAMARQMITSYRLEELDRLPKNLRRFMLGNLAGQLSTSCSIMLMAGDEGRKAYDDLRQAIRDFDPDLWRALRHNLMGHISTPTNRAGEKFLLFCYHTSRHIMKFE